jgi:hypothetical protein
MHSETDTSKLPGRKEISEWLDGWIVRYKSIGDPFAVSPEALFLIIGSNLGWKWDVEDVGRAIEHQGTRHEWMSPLSGFYKFLRETMAAKKAAQNRSQP